MTRLCNKSCWWVFCKFFLICSLNNHLLRRLCYAVCLRTRQTSYWKMRSCQAPIHNKFILTAHSYLVTNFTHFMVWTATALCHMKKIHLKRLKEKGKIFKRTVIGQREISSIFLPKNCAVLTSISPTSHFSHSSIKLSNTKYGRAYLNNTYLRNG